MKIFREWLNEEIIKEKELLEMFDLNRDYNQLSKSQSIKYWLKILKPKKEDEHDTIEELYSFLHWLKCYIVKNEGREYFIYSFYDKGVYEIHFYDMEYVQEDNELQNLKLTKSATKLFSAIITIMLDELFENSLQKIKIGAPKNKEKIYLKMIQKILKDYELDKSIRIINTPTGKDYLIESEFIKMNPMNIMELKLRENKEPVNRIEVLTNLRSRGL